MKHTKKLLIVSTIAWVLLLMVVFSDAWIARNWTPSVSQNSITISSSSALLISLDKDGETLVNTIDLNEMLNSDEFTLQQVSSHDAKVFHKVDFLPTLQPNTSPKYSTEVEGSYVDYTFYLMRQISNNPEEASEKLLFIHPDTHITSVSGNEDVNKAIRVAITIDNYPPIILSNCPDNYNDSRSTVAANATAATAGEEGFEGDVYLNYSSEPGAQNKLNTAAIATQMSKGLLYYHGGRTSYDNDGDVTNDYDFTPDVSRALIKMQEGQICTVNVKIWLEGGDDACTEAIAGQVFDFMLKFDSVDIDTVRTEE